MNKQTIKALITKLKLIVEQARKTTEQGKRRTRVINSEGITFMVSDDQLDTYWDVVRAILKNADWETKFSEKYLDKSIQSILAKTIKDDKANLIEKLFDELISNLETYSTQQKVYLPVLGIKMDRNSYEIGGVTLRSMTREKTEELSNSIEAIIQSLKDAPERKVKHIDLLRNAINQNILNSICSEFEAIAEPQRATERAIEETRRVLDLFYYAIPALYFENPRVHIGLVGDIFRSQRCIPVLSSDKKHFTLNSDLIGPIIPFEISQPHLDHMEKIGVLKIADVLKKSNSINSYEDTLLRAIHWYANSQRQIELENQLLNLITGLETLLTPRDGNPIRTAIAEGVAILLEQGVENRKKLKKRIQDFYSARSAVSHGGKKSILESDVNELRITVGGLIMIMIDRLDDFTSHKDLFEWIESQKFG